MCFGLESCNFRHHYKDMDIPVHRSKEKSEDEASRDQADHISFTSPYKLKILRERKTEKMEQINLVTGERRSWIEEKEYDLLDLCGEDTPPQNMAMKPISYDEPSVSRSPTRSAPPTVVARLQGGEEAGAGAAEVPADICPVCGRKFRGAIGVRIHRTSRTSRCKAGGNKENLNPDPEDGSSVSAEQGPDPVLNSVKFEPSGREGPGQGEVEHLRRDSLIPSEGGGQQGDCPVCGLRLPLSELAGHAAGCEQQQQTSCPVCLQEVEPELLDQHARQCATNKFGV